MSRIHKAGQMCLDKYNNVRSRCGPGNVYFIAIRQVSLHVDSATYLLINYDLT